MSSAQNDKCVPDVDNLKKLHGDARRLVVMDENVKATWLTYDSRQVLARPLGVEPIQYGFANCDFARARGSL